MQSGSLLHYAADIYSQRGDDGIIREILHRLGLVCGFFVEFGAWDGIHHSNTRLLFEKGWSGMFIEGDPTKARHLKENYTAFPDVVCIEGFVHPTSSPGRKSLDDYCDDKQISDIDFLSIDIDGLDLNVFENLSRRPKVVAIEGGFSWHPQMNVRVPDEVAARNLQQPLAISLQSVKAKGYLPVCFNQNLYAVESSLGDKFGGIADDAESLWIDAYYVQSEAFRSQVSNGRRNNPLVREYEAPYRSAFTFDV